MNPNAFDLVVLGGGPAGQKAAIQGAKAGSRVLLVDRARSVGGACVRFGAIPSKTLRETALALNRLKRLAGQLTDITLPARPTLGSLMRRREHVLDVHEQYAQTHLSTNGVSVWQGVAHFLSKDEIEVRRADGSRERVSARWFVIATGSHPRTPSSVPVDHEHILDSDSILSLSHVPASLIVLGSGAIACEYASVFAALGTRVTLIDRGQAPLDFLDAELGARFVSGFEAAGHTFLGEQSFESVSFNGHEVEVALDATQRVHAEKLLCALGRSASVSGLGLEVAGIEVSRVGFVSVDANFRTSVPHIYAVGDVAGPPALASTAMDQGRRAVCHALGIPLRAGRDAAPIGIYTIPELASIGVTEAEANKKYGEALVGRASFGELVRGQIAGADDGFLKIVCSPQSGRLLGVHAIGETATELVHVGQMAMLGGMRYDAFIDAVFNFPSYAEAYRVAALDILSRERGRNAAE